MRDRKKAILIDNDSKVNITGKRPSTTVGKIYDVWQDPRFQSNYIFINDKGSKRSGIKSKFILLSEHRCNTIDEILN